jgi:predicted phage-related endonuclease
MRILSLKQGSPEWLAARCKYRCASEAPIIMGAGKISRAELLRMKATGGQKEFSDWVQKNLLDKGHAVEAKARIILARRLGEDLYPITVVRDDLRLLSSLDGATVMDVPMEHKLLNEALVAQVKAGELTDPLFYWQLEHQLLTYQDAPYVLFATSDGTEENLYTMEYHRVPGRAEQLLAAWDQFDKDEAGYVYEPVAPVAVAAPIEALPALVVQIEGKVVNSNLEAFVKKATEFIGAINTDLQTDQHFADAAKMVTFCKDGEDRLELVKAQALAQTATIEQLFSSIDTIKEQLRQKRLQLDKLVATRKEAIRFEILNKAKADFQAHIDELNKSLGRPYMPRIDVDFAGAIRGKKTVASCKDGVAQVMATGKIEANRIHQGILNNLNFLREHADDYKFLFNDAAAIVLKAHDDLQILVKSRIAEHKAEKEREEAAVRERIRAEEQAKAEKEAREKVAAEQEAEDALIASFHENARRIEFDSVPYIQKAIGTYESVAKDWENDPRPRVVAAFLAGRAYLKERLEAANAREQEAKARQEAEAAKAAQSPAPAPIAAPAPVSQAPAANSPNVVPLRPAVEAAPPITLGKLCERLGFTVTAAFLGTLGFHPVKQEGAAKLYRASDFDLICEALIAHVRTVQSKQLQAA